MGKIQADIEGFSEEEQNILRSQFPVQQDLEVSDDEMLGMMGASVVAKTATKPASTQSQDPRPSVTTHELEEVLAAVTKAATEIEAELPERKTWLD